MLQRYPVTHWKRVARHDRIVNIVAEAASRAGCSVKKKPHLRSLDGALRKPDLVMRKENNLIISDVQISWEGPRLLVGAHRGKIAYYSTPAFLDAVGRRHSGTTISVRPLVTGARGAWCADIM